MKFKNQKASVAISAMQMLPQHANAAGNVHGGDVMKMMDSTAAIAAQRHCHSNVVTARVDELCFKKPVKIGDYVTCTARVVFAGFSSMEIFVTVESENLYTGETQIALTAFFTMVALDKDNKPAEIPKISPTDDEYSARLYEKGKERYEANKRRKI